MADRRKSTGASDRRSSLLDAAGTARVRSEVLNRHNRGDGAAPSSSVSNGSREARRGTSTRTARQAAKTQSSSGATAARGRHARQSAARSQAASRSQTASSKHPLVSFVKKNWRYICSVIGVALLAAVLIFFLRSCMSTGSSTKPEESSASASKPYVSPFDWTKVVRNDQRMAYVVDGITLSRQGIDVSENQHEIDWEAVAADGIDFAIIRVGYRGATEGELYLDEQFERNLRAAKEAGIDVGVYFFSQAVNEEEAIEEADFVLEHLQGTRLEYPIAFDSETVRVSEGKSRTAELSSDEMTAIQEAFRHRVEAAGYRTLVYGNAIDMSRYKVSSLKQTSLWWAEYNCPSPTVQMDIALWQYSNSGTVEGIETQVDMNIDLSGVLSN